MRDRTVTLGPGEVYIVPKGVEHSPVAKDEVHMLPIAPGTSHGSSLVVQYEMKGDKPGLMRLPKLLFNSDNEGKAIGINMFIGMFIGKRPYVSIGNSNGDREMLECFSDCGPTALFEIRDGGMSKNCAARPFTAFNIDAVGSSPGTSFSTTRIS